jgi:SAM-dependent methyltransferase
MESRIPPERPPAEEQRSRLLQMEGIFTDHEQRRLYLDLGWERMQVVLGILDALRARGVRRVLELGANPYFTTLQMQWRFDFDLQLANYFGSDGPREPAHVVRIAGEEIELPFQHFNAERDAFPYPDAAFDCVLFCEILEHLLVNPDHALAEIARVLRPGGFVVLSTPNATRLPNLYSLALGKSIWDDYSPHGPYGRHNREFTLAEVCALVERHDFDVDRFEVRNIERLARRYTWVEWLRPTVWKGHLFVVGRKRQA